MGGDLERVLGAVERLPSPADVNAVVGAAVTRGTRTVIPLAEVAYDFELTAERTIPAGEPGAGAGLEPDAAVGASRSRPIAVIESTPVHTAIRPVLDLGRLVPWAVMLAAWTLGCVAVALGLRERRGP